MSISSLDDLVNPDCRASFLDAFAAKKRWYYPAARAESVEALLPWSVIESLIANGLVTGDRFRVAMNGLDLSNGLYVDEKNRLRPDAVQALATQGATLVVNDIGGLVSVIGDFAIELERDLRCKVGVNCYITFGAVSAFLPHADSHDVLILQMHGVKRWRCFGAPIAFPVTGSRPTVTETEWEGLMTPGDLLYLPRGEVHEATSEKLPSVHLTIGIKEATGIDYLQWLAAKARDVEVLRRDLGALVTGEARGLRDQELMIALRTLIETSNTADFFAYQDSIRPLRSLIALGTGKSGGREFLPATRLLSALQRRVDLATEQEGELLLTFDKRKIRLSQLCRRALVKITDARRITVASLAAGLDLAADDPDLAACLEDLASKALIGFAN